MNAARSFVIVAVVVLAGCGTTSDKSVGSRDHLVGWYKAASPSSERQNHSLLIPVLKRDGTYYTTIRGFEVPMRVCPEGLEWSERTQSQWLLIGYNSESNSYYGRVTSRSPYRDYSQPGREQEGKHDLQLVKVDKPEWVLDQPPPPPKANDDFVGCFQATYFAPYWMQIRKDGNKYLCAFHDFGRPAEWQELTPRTNELGFTHSIFYNKTLKRFEIAGEEGTAIIRVPFSRIPPPSPEASSGAQRWVGYPFPRD